MDSFPALATLYMFMLIKPFTLLHLFRLTFMSALKGIIIIHVYIESCSVDL